MKTSYLYPAATSRRYTATAARWKRWGQYVAKASVAMTVTFAILLGFETGATAQNPDSRRAPEARRVPNTRRAPQRQFRGAARRKAPRPSSDPVRFVFSPKKTPLLPGEDPSALAIWSTLFTGNMSPEILQWHVHQRQWQQAMRYAERNNPAEAERIREERKEEKRSDYERMLARTHFSLSPYSEEEQDLDFGEPSSGAVLAQLLTGRSNSEIRQWKEDRAAGRYEEEQLFDTGAGDPETILAFANPAPVPVPSFCSIPRLAPERVSEPAAYVSARPVSGESAGEAGQYSSAYRQGYQAGLYAALASGIVNPEAADPRFAAVENFRPESAPRAAQQVASEPVPVQPVPVEQARAPRMQARNNSPVVPVRPLADDDFPGRTADSAGAIRPVAGKEVGAAPVQRADWITDNRSVDRPGVMKVYPAEKSGGAAARPLTDAPDEDNWMPVEP